MEHNEHKGKQTPGKISLRHKQEYNDTDGGSMAIDSGGWSEIAVVYQHAAHQSFRVEGEANAVLYAEAHNVANETQMWPREMQERIKKLEDFVGSVLAWDADSIWDVGYTPDSHRTEHVCIVCGSSYEHDEDCPMQSARALLTTPSTIN